ELQQQLDRFGLAQLEREALLVARIELPVDLHAVRAPGAQRVARLRLDLDHFRAEIGEHAGEGVAGNQPREVEDANAAEGSRSTGGEVAFCEHYSALMFASFATFFHPSISLRMVAANCCMDIGAGSAPSRRNTSRISCVPMIRFTSPLIIAAISGGVFGGARIPHQSSKL